VASCARAVPPRVEGTAKGTFDQLTPSPNNWSLPPSFRSTDTFNRSPVKRSASPQTALKRAMTKSRGQSWPIFACPLRQPSLSFPSFGFSAFRGFGFAFISSRPNRRHQLHIPARHLGEVWEGRHRPLGISGRWNDGRISRRLLLARNFCSSSGPKSETPVSSAWASPERAILRSRSSNSEITSASASCPNSALPGRHRLWAVHRVMRSADRSRPPQSR
jgi:hypothetical protein